jgi:hypothetical protein
MNPIVILTDLEAKTLAVYNINQALKGISGSIALLKKLKDAEAEQVTLTADLALAQEAMAVAQAADDEAKQEATYSRFGQVSIAVISNTQTAGSVIGSQYQVTYEIQEYDGRATNLVTKQAIGFGRLPHGLYEYIIAKKSHKLPAILLSLASDPATAMERYHRGLAKGYLEG